MSDGLNKIAEHLTSPNVSDSNGEPANLVDVGDRIADALYRIADSIHNIVIEGITVTIRQEGYEAGFIHVDVHSHTDG